MGEVERIVAGLTKAQREALMPGTTADRRPLLRLGLVTWKQRPGQRWPSLMPTSLGYAVRAALASMTASQGGEK